MKSTSPFTPVLSHYRKCDKCKWPMIGIMKISDIPPEKAPRTKCQECEFKDDAAK